MASKIDVKSSGETAAFSPMAMLKSTINRFFDILKRRPYLLLIPLALCQVYLFSWLFNDGMMLCDGGDTAGHALRAKFTINALRHLRFDGWFPYWYNGFQLYQFYAPMVFILYSLLYALSFGMLELATVSKLFIILAYIGQAVSIYLCMRLFDFRPFSSLAAAAFGISAHYFTGFGVPALPYQTTQSIAMVFVPIAIGLAYRALRVGGKYTVFAGVMLAFTMLSHPITGVFSFLSVGLLFIANFFLKWELIKIARFFFIVLLGFLLSALWLIPMYYNVKDMGLHTGWGDVELRQELKYALEGNIIGDHVLVYLGLAGIGFSILLAFFRRDARAISILLLFSAAAALAFGYINLENVPLLSDMWFLRWMTGKSFFYKRGMIFIAMFFPLFAGIAVDTMLSCLEKLSGRKKNIAVIIFAVVLLYSFVSSTLFYPMKYRCPLEDEQPKIAQIRELVDFIKKNTPESSLIELEQVFNLGMNFECTIPLLSERGVLEGCQAEGTNSYLGRLIRHNLASWDLAHMAGNLTRYGAGYLVTASPETASRLKSSEYFTLLLPGEVNLWKVNTPPSSVRILNKTVDFNTYAFSVESDADDVAVLPVSYNKRWFITVNSEIASFGKTSDNLIEVNVPSGQSTVKLIYTMDKVDMLSYCISIGTALILLLAGIYSYLHKEQRKI